MNYKKLFLGIFGGLIILTIIGWAVSQRSSISLVGEGVVGLPSPQMGLLDTSRPDKRASSVAREESMKPRSALTDQKVIKNGWLTLVVNSTDEAVSEVTKLVEEREGVIEDLRLRDEGDRGKQAFLVVRIPARHFSETMEALKAIANIVEDERLSGQDVTEQFIDLEARLRNLKATEAQFLQVLARADTVEDILNVHDRLSQVRGQIESLEGQLQYLTNQIDLSTIHLTLSEEPTVSLSLRDFRPITILKTSARSLLQGLIVVFKILIQIIVVWIPLIIVGGGLAALIIWLIRAIVLWLKHKFWA